MMDSLGIYCLAGVLALALDLVQGVVMITDYPSVVTTGGTLIMKCQGTQLEMLEWVHGAGVVQADSVTEIEDHIDEESRTYHSTMTRYKVTSSDQGEWTCRNKDNYSGYTVKINILPAPATEPSATTTKNNDTSGCQAVHSNINIVTIATILSLLVCSFWRLKHL
ncbi:unnamed protein product [Owenia fusiformis]|uniref:Uncharacterized protein n=1 Tax=Owenia fusiformis TaxID=6347 RepID=A0A8J1V0S7_OWEFU|nr:unnamed protein product [Owenia fusiformis]